jgi:hypothetical protein
MADSQHVGGLAFFLFKREKSFFFLKKQVGGVGGVEQCSEWRQLAVGGFFGWPELLISATRVCASAGQWLHVWPYWSSAGGDNGSCR